MNLIKKYVKIDCIYRSYYPQGENLHVKHKRIFRLKATFYDTLALPGKFYHWFSIQNKY